jgi:hypothetical protein
LDQRGDALAHEEPPELVLALLAGRAAALAELSFLLRDFMAAVEQAGVGDGVVGFTKLLRSRLAKEAPSVFGRLH